MDYQDMTAEELVRKLETAGRYPKPALIEAIWERREETEPLLLEVFRDSFNDDWDDDDDPRWYRLVHAGKFMLSWQNEEALPIFGRFYSTDDRYFEDMLEWFEEDLVHYGPAAVPYLKEAASLVRDVDWSYGPGLSGSILTKIAAYYPETRDDITAFFRSFLPTIEEIPTLEDYNEIWADTATKLGVLADEESRAVILALDEADLIQGIFFDREYYLKLMNKGYKPEQPPEPYDLRDEYRDEYEAHQKALVQEAKRITEAMENPVQQTTIPRSRKKVGRNDPCPCGSGRKYKRCHGRPGR